MLNRSLSIRRMNRNAPAICEPEYRPTFFTGDGERTVEQAAPITLKSYLVNRVYQSPAQADTIIDKLDEERSVEIADLAFFETRYSIVGLENNRVRL